MRQAVRRAVLEGDPRLVEAMFLCEASPCMHAFVFSCIHVFIYLFVYLFMCSVVVQRCSSPGVCLRGECALLVVCCQLTALPNWALHLLSNLPLISSPPSFRLISGHPPRSSIKLLNSAAPCHPRVR